jgi:hypothetical protein
MNINKPTKYEEKKIDLDIYVWFDCKNIKFSNLKKPLYQERLLLVVTSTGLPHFGRYFRILDAQVKPGLHPFPKY